MSGTWKIPFFGVDRQYTNIKEHILSVTDTVLSTGQALDGEATTMFESDIAAITGRKYAVAVNSCSMALTFSLMSLDYWYNDTRSKVLIPSISFPATINAVINAGYDPVFCDVDPVTGLIDLNTVPVDANEIMAIVYVNLFGNVKDYDKLLAYVNFFTQHKIYVIEDAAQSFGAYYQGIPSGKLGDISCLSFDPTKNLNNYGSGGMVLTDNYNVYEMLLNYRNNGKHNHHISSGTNSRMSEVDCAQMIVKLGYFDEWQLRRARIAEYYSSQLTGPYKIIPVEERVTHAWSKFVIHTEARTMVQSTLTEAGIESKVHYPIPLQHLGVAVQSRNDGFLFNSESFSHSCLSLPIYPEMTDDEVEFVVETLLFQ